MREDPADLTIGKKCQHSYYKSPIQAKGENLFSAYLAWIYLFSQRIASDNMSDDKVIKPNIKLAHFCSIFCFSIATFSIMYFFLIILNDI
jgi:hypothetical protein